ncbi:hypothetical protein Vretimale_3800 [Volvox reticuliferus]|nr:hypothetical protein Vretifemale_1458 [Volvox reticuliferus]GIL98472.1 hypothetical protein Vretimale_3800 [Volvox reticuliferus]
MRLLRSAFSPSEGQPIDSSHAPALLGPARHKPTVHLGRLLAGHRVLDLGSGTGLAGLSAAACGAHVLLTDLASVCEGTLRANMQRNCRTVPLGEAAASCRAQCSEEKSQQEHQGMAPGPCDGPWAGAVGIGQGSAAVMALDWTEPLEPQIQAGGNDPRDADFILAVDTIWLLDIFHAFLDIILAVLSHDRASAAAITTTTATPLQPGNEKTGSAQCQRACFLAFVERADADSKLFVPKEAVDQELRNRGLAVDTILAEDVDVDGVARPGRVLRVTLANH